MWRQPPATEIKTTATTIGEDKIFAGCVKRRPSQTDFTPPSVFLFFASSIAARSLFLSPRLSASSVQFHSFYVFVQVIKCESQNKRNSDWLRLRAGGGDEWKYQWLRMTSCRGVEVRFIVRWQNWSVQKSLRVVRFFFWFRCSEYTIYEKVVDGWGRLKGGVFIVSIVRWSRLKCETSNLNDTFYLCRVVESCFVSNSFLVRYL